MADSQSFTLNGNKLVDITIPQITNSPSYEPLELAVTVLAADYMSEVAAASVWVENDSPSLISFTHAFSVGQYLSTTALTFSSVSAKKNSFAYLLVEFPL